MPNITDNSKQQVVSPRCSSVPLLASKKLQDLVGRPAQANGWQQARATEKMLFKGLTPDVVAQLHQAVRLIDRRIDAIMRAYPPAMKNRLFAMRYGTVDALKAMPVKTALCMLGLDTGQVNIKLLANLNYFGHSV